MIKKYCKGAPLYIAAVVATLLVHGLAQYWDDQDTPPLPPPAQLQLRFA